MNNSHRVHVVDAFQDLEREILDLVCFQCVRVVADHIHQVLRAVLADHVQRLEVFRILGSHNTFQGHDVPVAFQNSQKPQFSQDAVRIDVIFKDVLDLLDRHGLVFTFVKSSAGTVLLFEFNHTIHET